MKLCIFLKWNRTKLTGAYSAHSSIEDTKLQTSSTFHSAISRASSEHVLSPDEQLDMQGIDLTIGEADSLELGRGFGDSLPDLLWLELLLLGKGLEFWARDFWYWLRKGMPRLPRTSGV